MKYLIKYYYIESDHILATPKFHHQEIVTAKFKKQVETYIEKQKDQYGNFFKKKNSCGYNFISNQGAVKLSLYISPKIKKL